MSLDNKNDLDIRCDAVQKVSTTIAKLSTEDVEKVVAFASLLKSGEKVTVTDKLEIVSIICGLDETLCFLERMRIIMECLLGYFRFDEKSITDENKRSILIDYNQHRIMCDIAFDYMIHVEDNCNDMLASLENINRADAKELTE